MSRIWARNLLVLRLKSLSEWMSVLMSSMRGSCIQFTAYSDEADHDSGMEPITAMALCLFVVVVSYVFLLFAGPVAAGRCTLDQSPER